MLGAWSGSLWVRGCAAELHHKFRSTSHQGRDSITRHKPSCTLHGPVAVTLAMSSPIAHAARRVRSELHGVVVSSGLMDKTVKVRVGSQKWNNIVKKVRHLLSGPSQTPSPATSTRLTRRSLRPRLSVYRKATSFTTRTPPYGQATSYPSSPAGPRRVTSGM